MEKKKNLISAVLLMFFGLLGGGSLITGEPEELIVWISIIVVGAIFVIVIQFNNRAERKSKLAIANSSVKDFQTSTKIESDDALFLFAIDNENRKVMIVLANNNETNARTRIVNFSDIISVDLLEDSNTIFSKSTMRTIGGGLVGGVLAGGAGAIVGGLSGNNKGKREVSRISVKLLVRNQDVPSIIIDCYNGSPMTTTGMTEVLYKQTLKEAQSIVDHVSVIIDIIDQESKQQVDNSGTPTHSISVADELEKLCALKDKGVLSEEEFNKQKALLLS